MSPSAQPIPTAAPADRPVEKFALREIFHRHAWEDLRFRDQALAHIRERFVLEAYRQGGGLMESPTQSVHEMTWDTLRLDGRGGFRPTGPFERPDAYEVRLVAKVVRLDG